ncbi:MAG: EAL domain-containing protein [Roseburia sp.]
MNKNITMELLCDVIDLFRPCMDDYLYIYDIVQDKYYISPNAAERFALPSYEFHNALENFRKFVYEDDYPPLTEDLMQVSSGKKTEHNLNYRWISLDGKPVWINCRGRLIQKNGRPQYLIGCINEIGRMQKADNISGLLMSASNLVQLLDASGDKLPDGYLLRIGIDDFKEVNEHLGIEYGDMLLARIASFIQSCLTPEQKVYRIVSDEFLVTDFHGGTTEEGIALYKRIRQKIDELIAKDHYEAVFTISGGILNTQDITESSYSSVMKLSEFALSLAKRRGKNMCCIYNAQDYEVFRKRLELIRTLRRAVNNNFEGFEMYYQPIFEPNTDQLHGAEALMRFKCEELGMISPMEFIPILEETGLIIPVGHWALHQSLSACKKLQSMVPDFHMNINLSYVQVQKCDISHEILSAVIEHGLRPTDVVIELTESGSLESNPRLSKFWKKLTQRGVHLALDDFGTGYSNFHYLYDLRPDIIKIDRSFTSKALENEYEYNLLSLMSDMVHNLQLKICVEGIETQDELTKIRQLSPTYIQGYYYGRPCPYDEFVEKYVQKNG